VKRLLVVAATERELAPSEGWRTLVCGVGPVDAAATTASALATYRPAIVVHVGIAGARRARALAPGSIVIGASSHYSDLVIPPHFAPTTVEPPPALVAALARALPDAVTLPIGTTARVGGATEFDVEAMEGFAVLRAAQLAGIPAIEVRAISNDIEEADRARWAFDRAFRAIVEATPLIANALKATLRDA
jgi:futalosine hydrolase